MKFKSLSLWIKSVLIGFACCGILVLAVAVPTIGDAMTAAYPEFSGAYWPWMVFLWLAAVPCYAVLAIGWLIASHIARDNAFSSANAKLLRLVAVLAGADAVYFFVGNITLLILNMNHPGIVLLSLVIDFIGFAVCVASAALSRLTAKAADISDENALTI